MRRHPVSLLVLAALLAAAVPSPVSAQTWRALVRGVVTDATGTPVAGALVRLVGDDTGAARDARTADDGAYVVPLVAPGRYRVEVTAQGFKQARHDLEVAVHGDHRVDVRLELGDVSEVVDVTGRSGQAETARLTSTIRPREIAALPLDGRHFLELALLTAGAAPAAPGSAQSVRGDLAFTAFGAREDFNSYLLDGADNVDPKLNTMAVRPALEAIREFEVLAGTYDAGFGRYAGAQINVITRSGSDVLAGSAFGFLRHDALNARNAFAPATEPAPVYERLQAGSAVGGPLVRGRAFFFANYEGTRRREGRTRLTTVPTLAERGGDFRASALVPRHPLTGQPLVVLPPDFQDPIGRAIAGLYPAPNRQGGRANFVSSPVERDDLHHADVRLDRVWSGGGDLTVRYSVNDRALDEPFAGPTLAAVPGFGNDVGRRAHSFLANDTRVLSGSWLNELRVSFTRVASAVTPERDGSPVNQDVGLPAPPARDRGLTYISVLGYSPLGHEINNPQESTTNSWVVSDTLTWSRGGHLVTIGADARVLGQDAFRDVLSRGQILFTGQVTGNPVADLLLGAPVLSVGARLDNRQKLRTESWSAFVQEAWQVRPTLTLSAGLRYERISPPVDPDDRATLYDAATGRLVQVGTNGLPRAGYEADTNNVAPRVGLAWMPGDDGRTLVRGGYGLYYSQSALAPGEALYFSPPYFAATFYYPVPGLFTLSLRDPFPAAFPLPTPPSSLAIQRDLATPSLQHWDAAVQRQLGRAWAVEVAYAGSRGRDLLSARDANQPSPSPVPFNPRPNPLFSDITRLESRARSTYHALMLTTERRVSGGFALRAGYTWSTSKDDASAFFASAGDPNFPQDSHNPGAEWGRSSFDVRHRLSAAAVWDLPFRGSPLVEGWQVSGVLTLQSGRPFTVALLPDLDNSNTGRSSLGFGANDRPNVTGPPALDSPTAERWFNTAAFTLPPFGSFGNAGRNILDGPGYAVVNAAIARLARLGARAVVELRLEAFNLLNRANYDLPDNFLGSPTFGQILSAQEPRRLQAGVRVRF
ncbi:MAG: carboxypeptidase regulatory-like domain-containing protein [Acidobacteriota bacterium]